MPGKASQLMAQGERDAALVDTLTEAFARELTQVMRLLNGEIRSLVTTLQTRNGRVVASRANLARAVQAKREINRAIEDAGFGRVMASAVDEPLDRLAAQVLRGDRIAHAAATLTPVDIDALVALKETRLAQLMGLGADLEAALWRTTLDGVMGARPVADLVADLAEIADVSDRQARVLYDTAASTYSRAAALLTSDGTPDELFLYVGPADSKTREFCLEWVGKVIPREQIDELDNGIKGYGNVLLTGGGPNCRHQWRLVSVLDDELRALANTGERVDYVASKVEALEAVA